MATDYKQYNYSGATYCGGSFASQGCGPTSVADLLDISPLTVADWMTRNGYATTDGHGTYWGGINAALTAFGAGGRMVASSMDGVRDCAEFNEWKRTIQSGYMGVLLMHCVTSSYWTSSGHYIAVVSYNPTTNAYLVYDPASTTRTGWHTFDDFAGNICCLYTSTKKWGKEPDTSYTFTVKQVQNGDNNRSVALLQRMLKSRGMYKGKIDSNFGPKTETAVRNYQKWIKDHGGPLKVDGICGPATWGNLMGKEAGYEFTVEQIRPGEKGIDIFIAQQVLAGRGYYQGSLDKSFGPATTQAVKDFQRKKGIAVDGVCGPTTWKKLIAV